MKKWNCIVWMECGDMRREGVEWCCLARKVESDMVGRED